MIEPAAPDVGQCPFHTTKAQAQLSNDFDAFTFLANPHPILARAANMFLVYGSANRDADQFPDPDRFDLEPEGLRKHLGLGFGAHFCVGAGLARLQLKIVLEELTALLPNLQLVPGAEQRYIDNVSFCGPRSLWLVDR